jgi:hypothetical protein
MGKKSKSGSVIQDEQPGSYFREQFFGLLLILKFFDAGPSGSGIRNLFDPGSGMEKLESDIRGKHPGYATLVSGESSV